MKLKALPEKRIYTAVDSDVNFVLTGFCKQIMFIGKQFTI